MGNYTNYLKKIDAVWDALRPEVSDNRSKVKRVLVILTASRSGSSYFKNLLMAHPSIVSPTGEEEPFHILTFNGFPFNSGSDAMSQVEYPNDFTSYLLADLTTSTPIPEEQRIDVLARRWHNRLPIQILKRTSVADIKDALQTEDGSYDPVSFLRKLVGPKAGLWDIVPDAHQFSGSVKIEEPPFVHIEDRCPIDVDDLGDKILLIKTPQNAYRIGIFEKLFPYAKIQYIHLTRSYAATVNGLIDGWQSSSGFFAHNMLNTPTEFDPALLDIAGYTDRYPYGRNWWKFDLPPNWHEFVSKSLPEVCLNQWESAHTHILQSGKVQHTVRFEDVLGPSRVEVMQEVFNFLGLDTPTTLPWERVVMATKQPDPDRWQARMNLLLGLATPRTSGLMRELGYTLRRTRWI